MKYALISDVHSNLPALEAVLADIGARSDVTTTYHLGDLVGYAPWPNETVELIRSRGIAGVAGNYDSTVGTDYKHCGCRYEDPRQEELSHISYGWTRQHVSPSTKQFLAGLPFRIDLLPKGAHLTGPRVVLVHGTPTLNTLYWTADRPYDFCLKMANHAGAKAGDVIAFGHTADDFCEALLRNIMFTGRLSALPPVTHSRDGEFRLIRPLVFVTEDITAAYAQSLDAPLVPCGCSQRTGTVRRSLRDIFSELEQEYPHLKENMLSAMGNLNSGRLLIVSE